MLAIYVAWTCSGRQPPESLLAAPSRAMRVVEISDAWNVPAVEPPERPSLPVRLLVVVAVLWIVGWWLVS